MSDPTARPSPVPVGPAAGDAKAEAYRPLSLLAVVGAGVAVLYAVVVQEILQDKIYLDASGQVQARGMSPGDIARRAMLGDISADLGGGDD